MAKTTLLVLGAGGHGRSVAEAASLSGLFEVVGFLDDALPVGHSVMGHPVLGLLASWGLQAQVAQQAIVAIGNNALRAKLIEQLQQTGMALATVVHPKAFVSPSATVGSATVIMAGAMIGTEAQLGLGTIVNTGAVVDHHAQVQDFGHLGVNACMAGGSILGRGAWMQAGSALGYGIHIPDGMVLNPGLGVDTAWLAAHRPAP